MIDMSYRQKSHAPYVVALRRLIEYQKSFSAVLRPAERPTKPLTMGEGVVCAMVTVIAHQMLWYTCVECDWKQGLSADEQRFLTVYRQFSAGAEYALWIKAASVKVSFSDASEERFYDDPLKEIAGALQNKRANISSLQYERTLVRLNRQKAANEQKKGGNGHGTKNHSFS